MAVDTRESLFSWTSVLLGKMEINPQVSSMQMVISAKKSNKEAARNWEFWGRRGSHFIQGTWGRHR